ncbi:glycosyltransferase [Aurantivibrio plasticivorans]
MPGFIENFKSIFPMKPFFELTPKIDYSKFHNEGPNGEKLLILGSVVSRREGKFVFDAAYNKIACETDWYPVPTPGKIFSDIEGIPENFNINKFVPNSYMPSLYKNYKALLVVGKSIFERGLPMSIAEAQAAGVCVIAPSLHDDFNKYVTDGGGVLFEDASQINELLSRLPTSENRQKGFQNAKKYDVENLLPELNALGFSF